MFIGNAGNTPSLGVFREPFSSPCVTHESFTVEKKSNNWVERKVVDHVLSFRLLEWGRLLRGINILFP